MRLVPCLISATLVTGLALLALPSSAFAQTNDSSLLAAEDLPESPRPQFTVAAAEFPAQAPQSGDAQGSSSSQPSAQQPSAEKSQHSKAATQLKEQEKQRILGILPSFNVSYRSDAASLTAKQKMNLAFRSSIDPVTFAEAFLVAGYHEGMHDNVGFPWGIKGYGERSGAAYLDTFDGNMIGNGILPAILHQDPRYFRLGHGAIRHRLLYAVAATVICKHDNTGKWEPNYSNVMGNIASGGISTIYYPSSDSGAGLAISNGFIVTAEGGLGSIFQEFWPDVSRKFLHKDPTNGLDAEARAKDEADQNVRKNQK
jgi:hypothetical protein